MLEENHRGVSSFISGVRSRSCSRSTVIGVGSSRGEGRCVVPPLDMERDSDTAAERGVRTAGPSVVAGESSLPAVEEGGCG